MTDSGAGLGVKLYAAFADTENGIIRAPAVNAPTSRSMV